ncbi:alpha/beta hydrolase [Gracilaria domingensis]|nr:alpha/beta hydrolase [Gracilaria domingensis]
MLFLIVYPSFTADFDSALVVVPGGPGGGPLTFLSDGGITSAQVVEQLNRPVILFDPRGAGNASRLNCSLQAKPLTIDVDPLDLRNCFLEIGEEILHYSATAIVNDLETLRNALGFKQLDLFGVSFGTLISQAYGVMYPDSIRSMLLDSPLPMRYKDVYRLRHHAAYARIYAEKNRNVPGFSSSKLEKQVKLVLHRLRWNRALRESVGIDPRLLFHMYGMTCDSFTNAIASAADEKNYTGLKQIASALEPVVQPLQNVSIAMRESTICNTIIDWVPWDVEAGFLERLGTLVYDLLHRGGLGAFSPFSLTEGFPSLVRGCVAMPFAQLRREGLPLDMGMQREIPALVLVGDLDSATPLENVVDLDDVFRRQVALVRGAGHVATQHPCGAVLSLEFAISGSVANMSSCK